MSKIFNSTNQYAGFYQTYSGGEAAITISRAYTNQDPKTGATKTEIKTETADANSGEGFLVNRYNITYQRSLGIQRFLNMTAVVGILGAGQGTIVLDGLVGKLESFQKLLMGSNNDTEDICSQLTVTIKDSSTLQKCSDGKKAGSTGTIICSGGLVRAITLEGQIDQSGILMQSGNITIEFTQLEIN